MVKPHEYGRWDIISEMVEKYGWTRGAELGVLRGLLFFRLLDRCPNLIMSGVDIWKHQPDAEQKAGGRSYVKHDLAAYERTVRDKARRYGPRAILHKMHTVDAAELYADEHFDFVFIDADHRYEGVRDDIAAWWPKVRSGGILMGHDFQPTFPGVMQAVRERFGEPQTFADNVWVVRRGD